MTFHSVTCFVKDLSIFVYFWWYRYWSEIRRSSNRLRPRDGGFRKSLVLISIRAMYEERVLGVHATVSYLALLQIVGYQFRQLNWLCRTFTELRSFGSVDIFLGHEFWKFISDSLRRKLLILSLLLRKSFFPPNPLLLELFKHSFWLNIQTVLY